MASETSPARYTEFPFPAQRYLPGQGMPHPNKHPGGSSIPHIDSAVVFGTETWSVSQRYLYAVDLFNYQYWWEAHEVLEVVWVETGKRTPVGKFIQGLIQIAASLLKQSQSIPKGARRLAKNGLSKIRSQPGVFLGVDVDDFGKQVEVYILGEGSALPIIELKIPARSA
jgi:predicted metal-dependent hydrolase